MANKSIILLFLGALCIFSGSSVNAAPAKPKLETAQSNVSDIADMLMKIMIISPYRLPPAQLIKLRNLSAPEQERFLTVVLRAAKQDLEIARRDLVRRLMLMASYWISTSELTKIRALPLLEQLTTLQKLLRIKPNETDTFSLAEEPPKPAAPQTPVTPPSSPTKPATPVTVAPADLCSKQHPMDLEMFNYATGARGAIDFNGTASRGWILVDTGASESLIRTATKNSPGSAQSSIAKISFPGAWSPELWLTTSNNLWDVQAPQGGQIATLGTDFMKLWTVRISTSDNKILFSDAEHSCSPDRLRSQGFFKMDTSGFYQREGQQVQVSLRYSAPNIPTVMIKLLGEVVVAQIDTGYQGPEHRVQINEALFKILKGKLGAKTGTIKMTSLAGGSEMDVYKPNGSLVFFDSDTKMMVAQKSSSFSVLVKRDGQSIAEWSIPAAMISSSLLFALFSEIELRADLRSIWVR